MSIWDCQEIAKQDIDFTAATIDKTIAELESALAEMRKGMYSLYGEEYKHLARSSDSVATSLGYLLFLKGQFTKFQATPVRKDGLYKSLYHAGKSIEVSEFVDE